MLVLLKKMSTFCQKYLCVGNALLNRSTFLCCDDKKIKVKKAVTFNYIVYFFAL